MILDGIDRASAYRPLSPRLAAALDYLQHTDFSKMADGRYDLDGDRVYALVQRYQTRLPDPIIWESHRRYIDVQYVAAGAERMGWMPLSAEPVVTQPYEEEKDAALYSGQGDFLELRQGSFVIFTPHDVHAPGLAVGGPAAVVKVVVKVQVNGSSGGCGF